MDLPWTYRPFAVQLLYTAHFVRLLCGFLHLGRPPHYCVSQPRCCWPVYLTSCLFTYLSPTFPRAAGTHPKSAPGLKDQTETAVLDKPCEKKPKWSLKVLKSITGSGGAEWCRWDARLVGRHFPVEHLVDDVCRHVSLILSGTKALLHSARRAHRPSHQLTTYTHVH